jgi:hypothetical protein
MASLSEPSEKERQSKEGREERGKKEEFYGE